MRILFFTLITVVAHFNINIVSAMDAAPTGRISPDISTSAGTLSSDLSQSTLWTVQSIQAPDLFHQFGISHPPSQWHLLNNTTVQEMLNNVGQKIGNSLLSERVQLSCLAACDMQKAKPAHNEKEKQAAIFTNFLKICLPSTLLRNLDEINLKKIEATSIVPLLWYVSTALNEENNKEPLEIRTRGFRVSLEKLIQRGGKPDATGYTKLEQIRKRIASTAPRPQADIMVLATTVLRESPAVTTATDATDVSLQLPSFNPTDSVLITQDLYGYSTIFSYLKERAEQLDQEIASLNTVLEATGTVLETPEISNTKYAREVREVLEGLLLQKTEEYKIVHQQYEGYLEAQSDVHHNVDTKNQILAQRLQERTQALAKVNEQEKLLFNQLASVSSILNRAVQRKSELSEQLEKLRIQREEILQAQQRLEPGLQAVAEFKKTNP